MAISLSGGVLAFGCSNPITLSIKRDEKLHLTGLNGTGRSTLLKTLMGAYPLSSGEMTINCPLFYFDQNFEIIPNDIPLFDNVIQRCRGLNESDARTLLPGIGFRGDRVFCLGKELSGGEKMKVAMLISAHQKRSPFLLLDEPDNHLDLASKQLLAESLKAYVGGFILVSHDSDFPKEAGISKEIRLL